MIISDNIACLFQPLFPSQGREGSRRRRQGVSAVELLAPRRCNRMLLLLKQTFLTRRHAVTIVRGDMESETEAREIFARMIVSVGQLRKSKIKWPRFLPLVNGRI